MIKLENLTKVYRTNGTTKTVLDNVNAIFPTGRSVALLGRNGAGKSTLLQLISGTVAPTSGRILTHGTVSYPVGFAGSFHPQLTGAQNTRFVARIYGVDTDALVDFVRDFAELGEHFHLPFQTYSAGMRSRLAFGVSMGIPFDTFLVDEITAVGDQAFRDKSARVFQVRRQKAGAIFVSHSPAVIRENCDCGAVLDDGRLYFYDTTEDALRHHHELMAATVSA